MNPIVIGTKNGMSFGICFLVNSLRSNKIKNKADPTIRALPKTLRAKMELVCIIEKDGYTGNMMANIRRSFASAPSNALK